MCLFTGSQKVAEKLAVDLRGKVRSRAQMSVTNARSLGRSSPGRSPPLTIGPAACGGLGWVLAGEARGRGL